MITEYCIGCIHLDEDLVACLYCLNRRVSRAYTMGEADLRHTLRTERGIEV